MHEFSFPDAKARLPRPAGSARAESLMSDFLARAEAAGESDFARAFAQTRQGRALLETVFGTSPYLSRLILKDLDLLRRLAETGPDPAFAEALRPIETGVRPAASPGTNRETLMADLRTAKRHAALVVALADLAGAWDVDAVTGALSRLAELAVGRALDLLIGEAVLKGDLAEGTTAATAGYVVLAMGKLGARELNYSSDIDLIVLFDQEADVYRGKRSVQDLFSRLTQDLVHILQERTREGYVFRTDLRLRPDAGATPVALSMAAAETYYESVGQNWERAALIKARPVAGDLDAGREFLCRIGPFIWRKHLDFTAIADIHSIKRQTDSHGGHRGVAVAGHNLKLGRGGIREIEFFAQTQQLIGGGRDPRLREARTLDAIAALADTGRIEDGVEHDLAQAYRFLRRLEHRLQMIDDEQTHTLPATEDGMARIAAFAGNESVTEFSDSVLEHLNLARTHYANLFEEAPSLAAAGNLVFTGTDDDPDTLETLDSMGFSGPSKVVAVIRQWHHGRYRGTRSARAREILTALAPRLLESLAATAYPDAAFARFDEFLKNLPAGIQLFSLFHSNPRLLDLVAEITGMAPRLAETLARSPQLLDAVLLQGITGPLPNRAALANDLEKTLAPLGVHEELLDRARRWKRENAFLVGARVLRQTLSAEEAGAALSDLAEATILSLLPRVTEEFAVKAGTVPGGGLVVLGLGKLGSREMMFGSDLDLIFLYDHPAAVETSDGIAPLAVSQYFARLGQRFINALSAMTSEGRLYEIDMRLRPSGAAGPIAIHRAGFEKYQREDAWIWERMALTRARVIAGDAALSAEITSLIAELLQRPCDDGVLVEGVADMRGRIDKEYSADSPWDVKYARGGLVDLEFLCQYFQLRCAPREPRVLAQNTIEAFRRLEESALLEPGLAARLADVAAFYHRLYNLLRLCLEGSWSDETIPSGLAQALVRVCGETDFRALSARLIATEEEVYGAFRRFVEVPAAGV